MSVKMKTAVVVVVLLAGIAGFNYVMRLDPVHLAERGVGRDSHSHGPEEEYVPEDEDVVRARLLTPFGPEGAPLTIHVLWRDREELESVLRPMLAYVADSYEGHVRVEIVDPESDQYMNFVQDIGIGMGLLIDGEMIKEVPQAPLGMLAFEGSPSFSEWGPEEIILAVEHDLRNKGVAFTRKVIHPAEMHPGHDPSAGGACCPGH